MEGLGLPEILAILFSFIIGVIFGAMAAFLSRGMMANRQIRIAQRKAAKIVAEARVEAKDVLNETKSEADKLKTTTDAECKERRVELQRQENRLTQKESTLEHKLEDAQKIQYNQPRHIKQD